MSRFWHPFADMAAVSAGEEFVLDSGAGVRLRDTAGRDYLDATASLWYANVGYGRTEIATVIAEQATRLHAYSCFGDTATSTTLELADRLAGLAPVPDSAVFLTSGGSDSVDTAVKLALRYWNVKGQPHKSVFVIREHAYHGMHGAGTGLAGIDDNSAGYGALYPEVRKVPWDNPEALAAALDSVGPENVAAFFCEPVIAAGGVLPPPEGYLAAVREICRQRDVLFVADEVVTGFGRTGDWFASARFGLDPDMVLCGKGITSGYLPLGAVLIAPQVTEPFWGHPGRTTWRHGYTYSGHATAAAASLANIAIIEREGLCARTLTTERRLTDLLTPLERHPLVSEVRSGTGLLGAVQLADPTLSGPVVAAMRERGVLTRTIAGGALAVSPPLIIDDADLATIASAFEDALTAVHA
ncbi:aspartate aminotransferase family protein [Streptomyces hygroscopicus]|uniref:aminotransferase family protein n=1 Tax=Streptomyces hygroscopicus TaxID=1912 RepID=UPI00363BCC7D